MTKNTKNTRGGARPGAGRKPTGAGNGRITFRADQKLIDRAKELHGKELNELFRGWLKKIGKKEVLG